jgi:hypothetical protein
MRDNVVIVRLRLSHHGFGDLAHIASAKERIGKMAHQVAHHFHYARVGVQRVDPALALEVRVDELQRRGVQRGGALSQNSGCMWGLRRRDHIEVLELHSGISRHVEQEAGEIRAFQECA